MLLGIPGKQFEWMSAYGHRLKFDENGQAICPESGEEYILSDKQVSRML